MSRIRAVLTAVVALSLLLVLPMAAASADPLPPGSYDVTVGDDSFVVVVDESGVPSVEGESTVDVTFSYEDGVVQDEFVVATAGGTWEVEIDASGDEPVVSAQPVDEAASDDPTDNDPSDEDASDEDDPDDDPSDEASDEDDPDDDSSDEDDPDADDESDDEEGANDEADEEDGHGELVSAVARCVPTGKQAREAGLPNHGSIVSAVARGEQALTLSLPVAGDPDTPSDEADGGEPAVMSEVEATFDLTTVAGIDELCAALADAVTTAQQAEEDADRDAAREQAGAEREAAREQAKAEREAAREQAKAEREAAREEARAVREAAREEAEAARDEAKAAREAAKDEAEAARDSAKAERRGSSNGGNGKGTRDR